MLLLYLHSLFYVVLLQAILKNSPWLLQCIYFPLWLLVRVQLCLFPIFQRCLLVVWFVFDYFVSSIPFADIGNMSLRILLCLSSCFAKDIFLRFDNTWHLHFGELVLGRHEILT